MKINLSELFYSLQGEGIRAGCSSIFIRVQGCKAKHACAASGVKCDTEFESGKEWHVHNLLDNIIRSWPQCTDIVWTGGEPADQVTDEIAEFFSKNGYYQCIETSGLFPVSKWIDFITLSPKVAEHIFIKNFPLRKRVLPSLDTQVDEVKFVRHIGQEIPKTEIISQHYMVSPHSDGFTINRENLQHCIKLCLANPKWRLSVQQHKFWNIL